MILVVCCGEILELAAVFFSANTQPRISVLFLQRCPDPQNVALNSAVALKPVFNQYDPAMLERVRYDDTLAGVAAQQSGRPTYCDNRYYRAVANGGQGM